MSLGMYAGSGSPLALLVLAELLIASWGNVHPARTPGEISEVSGHCLSFSWVKCRWAGQLMTHPLGSSSLGTDSSFILLPGKGRQRRGGVLTAASDTTLPGHPTTIDASGIFFSHWV